MRWPGEDYPAESVALVEGGLITLLTSDAQMPGTLMP